VKAVDDETGKILGMCGWRKWNFDGSKPALVSTISTLENIPAHPRWQAEGEENPRAGSYCPEPLPADHRPIDDLKKKKKISDDRKK
jgi:hypothetical protein